MFTYTITVTDKNGDAVWFSAQDENGTTVSIDSHSSNVTAELDTEGNPTGSYSVPSGAQFTISIKNGWNVRFFNLPTGTTYSIQETGSVPVKIGSPGDMTFGIFLRCPDIDKDD